MHGRAEPFQPLDEPVLQPQALAWVEHAVAPLAIAPAVLEQMVGAHQDPMADGHCGFLGSPPGGESCVEGAKVSALTPPGGMTRLDQRRT